MTPPPPTADEISDEDQRLQDELNLLVERLKSNDMSSHRACLEELRTIIRTATTSMTSVPKPLKYLRQHYQTMKDVYIRLDDDATRKLCADVISVMAMAGDKGAVERRDCLHFCLLGALHNVGDWGHEYLRQLEGELVEEWPISAEDAEHRRLLTALVLRVASFDMKHHAEIQACDLLMEVERMGDLEPLVDAENYAKVCLYLSTCALYLEPRDADAMLALVARQYRAQREFPRALVVAAQRHDSHAVAQLFEECADSSVRKQMAFLTARQQLSLALPTSSEDSAELQTILSNTLLSEHFRNLGRDLDILAPKTPDEIFKTWLETIVRRPAFHADAPVDSARHNLACSFVNAFVNAGFGTDALVSGDEGHKWIIRNKDSGILCATASLGVVYLWDADGGLTLIDRYLYSSDDNIKAGALLALGIVNTGVANECDPAQALLAEYIMSPTPLLRAGAVLGLGLAYVATNREDIIEMLLPALTDPAADVEAASVAGLALGLVAAGSCNGVVAGALLQYLLEASPVTLRDTHARFLALALGLCYIGRRDAMQASREALEVLPDPFRGAAIATLAMCAFAGSGDVMIAQGFLHACAARREPAKPQAQPQPQAQARAQPQPQAQARAQTQAQASTETSGSEKPDKRPNFDEQSISALAVGVVAMGEDIGSEMSTRIFAQMARYGDPSVRKAVPLALAVKSVSDPRLNVIDALNKMAHDSVVDVASSAILAMGLVGAGSNNARLATMLRHMAAFHARNASLLFLVRLAQGLVHLGKGTLSLSPFHAERQLMSVPAMAGLLVALVTALDARTLVLGTSPHLLFALAAAMHPRWLVTLDENLDPLPVQVRVGQAVDVVGKAGTPKVITGIRTSSTPVLLAAGERAELATGAFSPLSPVLEGFVLLRKTPGYHEDEDE